MKIKHVFLILVCIITTPAFVYAELSSQQLKEDFEFFFDSYKEAYVFFELKGQEFGVDWDAMKEEYAPTVEAMTTKRELCRLVNELQTRLHDGHCGNKGLTEVGPISLVRGISFTNTSNNTVCVKSVRENSLFEANGIEKGDKVLVFKGKSIKALRQEARTLFAASSEGQFNRLFANMLYIYHPFLPQAPSDCECSFEKPDGTIISLTVPFGIYNPKDQSKGPGLDFRSVVELDASGPLPMKAALYEERNIGYVKLESFMKTENPTEQFDKIFSALADTKAIILDLRDNGGGVGPWGILLSNYFIDSSALEQTPNESYMERNYSRTFFKAILKQASDEEFEQYMSSPQILHMIMGKLGINISLTEVQSHFINGKLEPFYFPSVLSKNTPGIPPYKGKLVALTNGGCYSTTDICLTLLDDFERVTTIGTPNGAGSGSPISMILPNSGLEVMVPHARAYPPSKRMIEGHPLNINITVEVTQEDLIAGIDRHLVTAIEYIEGTSLQTKRTRNIGNVSLLTPDEMNPVIIHDSTGSLIPDELKPLVPDYIRGNWGTGKALDIQEIRDSLKN